MKRPSIIPTRTPRSKVGALLAVMTASFFLQYPCSTFAQIAPANTQTATAIAPANTQTATASPTEKNDNEKTVILSPFVVSTDKDVGYFAANTLAGTRMNTSLIETPAAITVLTKELLNDIGATNTRDYLKFATSAAQDDTSGTVGQSTQYSDVLVRIRGFSSGGLVRDYFTAPGGVLADSFNVDRVDLSRGPNAVLYGIGGPGGVINTSSKWAIIDDKRASAAFTFGSFKEARTEADLTVPVVRHKLALRVNSVIDDGNGWREFEDHKTKGLALAATYRPLKNTAIRLGYERMTSSQHIPWFFPPQDLGGTKWLANGAKASGNVLPGTNPDPTTLALTQNYYATYAPQDPGQRPIFRYSSGGVDMRPDLAGTQSSGFWQTLTGPVSAIGGTSDDPYFGTMIPKRSNMMGDGSRATYGYTVATVIVDQKIGDFDFEVAGRNFRYDRWNMIVTGGLGLMADPNAVLPGAYEADGAISNAVGNKNPGTLLSNIGAANPYEGQLYETGFAQQTWINTKIHSWRGSVSYHLDLTKASGWTKWLGQHQFIFMGQNDKTWQLVENQNEWNTAANNGLPIDNFYNEVQRLTYLNFNDPNGQHGALDPLANPVPKSTGVDVQWLQNGVVNQNLTRIATEMMAGQSAFWDHRIVVTGGYRWDDQIAQTASAGGVRVPNSTNLWYTPNTLFNRNLNWTMFSGRTRTLGLYLAPVKWVGFTVNSSNSVQPQPGTINVLHQPVPMRSGKGKDYGIRFNLLGGRIYLNANVYKNNDQNGAVFYVTTSNAFDPALNAIVVTQKALGQALPQVMQDAHETDLLWTGSERDISDNNGKGYEIELVGNITKNWSVSYNYSQNKIISGTVAKFYNGFYATVAKDWANNPTPLSNTPTPVATYVAQRDGTPSRNFTLNPATFADAYAYAGTVLQAINLQSGRPGLGNWRDQSNFFTSYRFNQVASSWPLSWLNGTRIGVGGNFHSPPVIGYDANNNSATLYGKSTFYANLMVGKSWALKRGHSIDVQLNVDNLFGESDMLPYSALTAGQVQRYIYPRLPYTSWKVRTQFNF